MSETEQETPAAEAEAVETPAEETPSEAPAWAGPSQEEWKQQQKNLAQMQQILQQATAPPEEDEDDLDIGSYVQREIERGLAPVRPIVAAAQAQQGQVRLTELHDQFEAQLKRPFDRKLAERLAQSYLSETGGDAVKAVEAGVRAALELEDSLSKKALDSYKKSLARGPHDAEPTGGAGGDRSVPKAKSYDEVIERWSGTDEV